MSTISRVSAREVLDSRARPTVEVDVGLVDGSFGRASVPSGASTGTSEALELRDGDKVRYNGQGVRKAIENVNLRLGPTVVGLDAQDQETVDRRLIEIDGTPEKREMGGNAILGISLATAHAAAAGAGKPLWAYLSKGRAVTLPVPMFNIVNGGRHAEDSTDFQEFMVVPAGFFSFSESLRAGVEIYHALKAILSDRGLGTTVGDEGGFAPSLSSNSEAVEIVVDAIGKAGYVPGKQCFIALDVAASEFFGQDSGRYSLTTEAAVLGPGELVARYEDWVGKYPIISIEDGMSEEDWDNWDLMTSRIGGKVQLVGDDLYTTNTTRIEKGVGRSSSNAVLIKPNQIGTITETLEAMELATGAGWQNVISHRSGETEDTSIADLAVGTAAGQIKSGAPARGERTAKYNQLLRIEQELGDRARFAGIEVYERFIS
jgi:enolase